MIKEYIKKREGSFDTLFLVDGVLPNVPGRQLFTYDILEFNRQTIQGLLKLIQEGVVSKIEILEHESTEKTDAMWILGGIENLRDILKQLK